MTAVANVDFSQVVIMLGNGADPEVFAKSCLFNSERGVEHNIATNTVPVPDCDDDTKPSADHVNVTGVGISITGSGLVPAGDLAAWNAWALDGTSKNVRVIENGSGGRQYDCAAKLTSYSKSVSRGEFYEVSVTLSSTGAVTEAAAA